MHLNNSIHWSLKLLVQRIIEEAYDLWFVNAGHVATEDCIDQIAKRYVDENDLVNALTHEEWNYFHSRLDNVRTFSLN